MGKTIVISSHILPELTELCTMVGIIDHGRIRATGPVHEVIQQLTSGRRLRITVLGRREEATSVLKGLPAVRGVLTVDDAIEAQYEGDDATAAGVLQSLIAAGIKVSNFTAIESDLEDAFLKATSEDVG
jgi:ABC-2 type transport system ATP-binding protein